MIWDGLHVTSVNQQMDYSGDNLIRAHQWTGLRKSPCFQIIIEALLYGWDKSMVLVEEWLQLL